MAFIESVFSSLVAGIILLLFAAIFSEKARWTLTAAFGRILDIDVDYVFVNKQQANRDISKELNRAHYVYMLTGRGAELQRDTFESLLNNKTAVFRVLLPVTDQSDSGCDWVALRENELSQFDTAYGDGILRNQIETTAQFLRPFTEQGHVEVRRYDYPHVGRILITNRAAYLTPYPKNAHGRNSHVIKYRAGGDTYEFLKRLFEQLWDTSASNINPPVKEKV